MLAVLVLVLVALASANDHGDEVVAPFDGVLNTCYREAKETEGGLIRKCREGTLCLLEHFKDTEVHGFAPFSKLDKEKIQERFDAAKAKLQTQLDAAKARAATIDQTVKDKLAELEAGVKETLDTACASITNDEAQCLSPAQIITLDKRCTAQTFTNNPACDIWKARNPASPCKQDCQALNQKIATVQDAFRTAVEDAVAVQQKGVEAKAALLERVKEHFGEAQTELNEMKTEIQTKVEAWKTRRNELLTAEDKAMLAALKAKAEECKAMEAGEAKKACVKELLIARRKVIRIIVVRFKVAVGVRCIKRFAKLVKLRKLVDFCDCDAANEEVCLRKLYAAVTERAKEFCADKGAVCEEIAKRRLRSLRVHLKRRAANDDGNCEVDADVVVGENVTDDEEEVPDKRIATLDFDDMLNQLATQIGADFEADEVVAEDEAVDASVPEEEIVDCELAEVEGLCEEDTVFVPSAEEEEDHEEHEHEEEGMKVEEEDAASTVAVSAALLALVALAL